MRFNSIYPVLLSVFIFGVFFSRILSATSHNVGLLFVFVVLVLTVALTGLRFSVACISKFLKLGLPFLGGLLVHYLISQVLLDGHDIFRFSASFFFFSTQLLLSVLFFTLLVKSNPFIFNKAISFLHSVFIFFGGYLVISLYVFETTSFQNKDMIIFAEPSHFALMYAPVLAYCVDRSSASLKYLWLVLAFLFVALHQSVTLVVLLLIVMALTYRSKDRAMYLIITLIALLYTLNYYDSLDYFVSRLSMLESNNLTALSYRSAWERSVAAFMESGGWGVGFQQYGIVGKSGDLLQIVFELGGQGNLLDGTALAPKIVAEGGIFGVLLLLIYSYKFFIVFIGIRKGVYDVGIDKFFANVFVLFSVYFFVRGVGYFSPIFFLYLSSCVWLVLRPVTPVVHDVVLNLGLVSEERRLS